MVRQTEAALSGFKCGQRWRVRGRNTPWTGVLDTIGGSYHADVFLAQIILSLRVCCRERHIDTAENLKAFFPQIQCLALGNINHLIVT